MAREAEAKEVTRAELEGKLWERLENASYNENWLVVARLVHESISAREAARKPEKRPPSTTPGMEVV